jgi:uncharacterized membrane protein YkgB
MRRNFWKPSVTLSSSMNHIARKRHLDDIRMELMNAGGVMAELAAPVRLRSKLEAIGGQTSRYGLVAVLLLIGALKFTPQEAAGIQPLVAHSPLMSWMYAALSVQGASNVIGVIEVTIAALIALRPVSSRASFAGSLGAAITFLFTLEFPVHHAGRGRTEIWVSGTRRCGTVSD